ncbi:MAG: NADP-dependent oxidoreductase [Gammaproteobacteria bacterium]|nr:NADP-dependent oxidoreductase [Gammaproteobacteria bacterium]
MSGLENVKWVVASRPEAEVQASNFEMKREPVAPLGPGCMLLKARYFTVNPPARMALVSGGIARRPIPIGATMRGSGLAEVVESRNPDFEPGDLVMGDLGWQRYVISDGVRRRVVNKVQPREGFPASTLLHVLGGSGATAYFGMTEYARPRVGDTLVVSTAAGNVGALVCQLAKMQGCRVVGIAGGARKCGWLVSELGCDAAIDYKSEDVPARLDETCPNGIDIYFDHVGGAILDAALARIAQGARVVLCGGTSQYNNDLDWYGPKNYFNLVYKQAEMTGFYVFNFRDRFEEAHSRLAALIAEGKLQYREDILEGVENLPEALMRLFRGDNFGTQLVHDA